MHNLTYSVSSIRSNQTPSQAFPQKTKTYDKKVKFLKNDKQLTSLTLHKIMMSEVFEKHNDLEKTRPFTSLIQSNLAHSVSKIFSRKQTTKIETFNNQKLIANIIASTISNEANKLNQNFTKYPKIGLYFDRNNYQFQTLKFNQMAQIESFASIIFSLSDLKGKDAMTELTNLAFFKKMFNEIDLSKTTNVDFVYKVFKMLKILFKTLGKESVQQFRNYEFIRKIFDEKFEDKKLIAFKQSLAPMFFNESSIGSVVTTAEKVNINGNSNSARKQVQSQVIVPIPVVSSVATLPVVVKTDLTVTQNRVKNTPVMNFIVDSETSKQQRQIDKEVSAIISKDASFKALVRPFFELSSETNFYQSFVEKTFSKKDNIPRTFEEMLTYFPNYHILNELIHQPVPNTTDIEKSIYILQTLFPEKSNISPITFEEYIEKIVFLIQSQNKVYIPYLLQEENFLRYVLMEICQNKFVLINMQKNEIKCESIGSINDAFFSQIPLAFKQNLRFLFYVYFATKIFSNNLELMLTYLQTHPFFDAYGLSLDFLVRMIIFVKFIQGEKVHVIYDQKITNEIIFKETLRAFTERPEKEVDVKLKDHFNEFIGSLKKGNRIDFLVYFSKKNENKVQSYQENLSNFLSKSSFKAPETKPKHVNFLTEPSSKLNVSTLKGLVDKKSRYDYKKLLAFKKQFRTGEVKRIEE